MGGWGMWEVWGVWGVKECGISQHICYPLSTIHYSRTTLDI